jgi:hypothetical protein
VPHVDVLSMTMLLKPLFVETWICRPVRPEPPEPTPDGAAHVIVAVVEPGSEQDGVPGALGTICARANEVLMLDVPKSLDTEPVMLTVQPPDVLWIAWNELDSRAWSWCCPAGVGHPVLTGPGVASPVTPPVAVKVA